MHTRRQTWPRLAVAIGLIVGSLAACVDDDDSTVPQDTEPAPTDPTVPQDTQPAPTDPCGPSWTLEERLLNDRCTTGPAVDVHWTEALTDDFPIWIDRSTCESGAPTVAAPNEVLVAVDDVGTLDSHVEEVVALLGDGASPDEDRRSTFSQIVVLDDNPEMSTVLEQLPSLQGQGRSVDLNYLEPLQPNDAFRPNDDPEPVPEEEIPVNDSGGDGMSVLVLDSTDDTALYDINGNDLVDEDHGHGVFVADIIGRLAPDATVVLAAVDGSGPRLDSGRWAPMMFSDFDVIEAMEGAFAGDNSYDVVNLSLGGAGCTESDLGFGIGERLALARTMHGIAASNERIRFVAAAGNGGADVTHFPAAWVDPDAMRQLAGAVEVADPIAADEVRALHAFLVNVVIAVGSVEPDSSRSPFSNCGSWVNAVAHGTDQIGKYDNSPTGYATWSGTSFATANVSASLVGGQVFVDYPINGLPC